MSDLGAAWAAVAEGFKTLQALGRGISEPIQEIVGMGTDHFKVVRFERQVRLADRVRAVMREHGIERLDRRIPLNTLLPILEHASLEEDDDLQDIWARLLATAGDTESLVDVRRAFVAMLADMTAFDVRNLATLYNAEADAGDTLWTPRLPEQASAPHAEGGRESVLRQDVEISLGNLARLGCLNFGPGLHAKPTPYFVSLTALGRAFIIACTAR